MFHKMHEYDENVGGQQLLKNYYAPELSWLYPRVHCL